MIDLRPLTRPLPLLLICLFLAVAAVDFYHHLRHQPEPLPDLLQQGPIHFEALEPVVDFRPRVEKSIIIEPRPHLVGDGWSQGGSGGVWITERRATLELEMKRAGHRALVIECRPAKGRAPAPALEVRVNGRSCGTIDLEPGWNRYRLELDEGVVRAGTNQIAFVMSAGGESSTGRRMLLRRLGLFLSRDVNVNSALRRAPVSRNLAKDTVVIRRSGMLELPVDLDGRADSLRLYCRFVGGGGRCEVVMARPQGTGAGLDPAVRREVQFPDGGSTGVRIPVHGRRGEFVLSIDAELDPSPAKLVIRSPRLVRETGRPPSTGEDHPPQAARRPRPE